MQALSSAPFGVSSLVWCDEGGKEAQHNLQCTFRVWGLGFRDALLVPGVGRPPVKLASRPENRFVHRPERALPLNPEP